MWWKTTTRSPTLKLRHALADRNHLPGSLVAEDARGRMRSGGDLLQVRSADAAGVHAHQQLARRDFGHRNGFQPYVVLSAINRRLHGGGNLP